MSTTDAIAMAAAKLMKRHPSMKLDTAWAFWVDAAELGFVKLGRNERGTNVFGWRSEVAP